jgi:hypothetical protein
MQFDRSSCCAVPLRSCAVLLAVCGTVDCVGTGEGLNQNGQRIDARGTSDPTADFRSIQDNVFTSICADGQGKGLAALLDVNWLIVRALSQDHRRVFQSEPRGTEWRRNPLKRGLRMDTDSVRADPHGVPPERLHSAGQLRTPAAVFRGATRLFLTAAWLLVGAHDHS